MDDVRTPTLPYTDVVFARARRAAAIRHKMNAQRGSKSMRLAVRASRFVLPAGTRRSITTRNCTRRSWGV
jgi:hypothetical protein